MKRRLDRRGALVYAGATAVLLGCGARRANALLLSEAPLEMKPVEPARTSLAELPPVQLPEDEAPHDVLAEWWYYTGHLYGVRGRGPGTGDGKGDFSPLASRLLPLGRAARGEEEYGFELVFFRGVRGDRPPGYAAHFSVTDLAGQRFRYDQRQDVALNETAKPAAAAAASPESESQGPGAGGERPPGIVSYGPSGGGFDLALGGWRMRGRDGHDHLIATMPGYALEVELQAVRPPALHTGDPPLQPGLISFGPAGYSYYYSRTRMALQGTLVVEGEPVPVRGEAWMDHQWGDFLVLGGGWDWFAGNLDDGRDVTISLVRDASGKTILAYGTLVDATGESRQLPPDRFEVSPKGTWTSPHTGITYPSGWRVRVPDAEMDLLWEPLLVDQELDTRKSTGVAYWEGAVALRDPQSGTERGRGYVELTGYGR
ncbi:MAG: hypothetical protein HY332_09565 [Chloroflexi bacterium]|nr:hypothetical protein [Chloroflexota bacterium]